LRHQVQRQIPLVLIADICKRLLGVAETIHRWAGALAQLDGTRRERVALYAERIADTLGRASEALIALDSDPADRAAARRAARELGRIAGYVETMVSVLRHHLDGRKLAGVKRRLDQLGALEQQGDIPVARQPIKVQRLIAAEGYFRALADGLRT
jgi:hypothetical protein